ncbi:tail fiber/spike domain-containing protein [Hafnia paralvei]|uniref:tail fiber/spike domain-containing protein n=1 Tax=Hafnia paralvei TaxID=546367 RepID=UPI0038D0428B
MATQPTNLPVPSESPRDLKFNAGKIDEFVTSSESSYTDRFGNKHYTIEGISQLSKEAMTSFGYITMDSFEDGNTLTLPNQVLRLEATGEYYRWDGAFPKVVPAASTPESTGGIGAGKWLSVGDATLRGQISDPDGATKYPELQIARWRDEGDVRGWGEGEDGFNAAMTEISENGGGVLYVNEDITFSAIPIMHKPKVTVYWNGHRAIVPAGLSATYGYIMDGGADTPVYDNTDHFTLANKTNCYGLRLEASDYTVGVNAIGVCVRHCYGYTYEGGAIIGFNNGGFEDEFCYEGKASKFTMVVANTRDEQSIGLHIKCTDGWYSEISPVGYAYGGKVIKSGNSLDKFHPWGNTVDNRVGVMGKMHVGLWVTDNGGFTSYSNLILDTPVRRNTGSVPSRANGGVGLICDAWDTSFTDVLIAASRNDTPQKSTLPMITTSQGASFHNFSVSNPDYSTDIWVSFENNSGIAKNHFSGYGYAEKMRIGMTIGPNSGAALAPATNVSIGQQALSSGIWLNTLTYSITTTASATTAATSDVVVSISPIYGVTSGSGGSVKGGMFAFYYATANSSKQLYDVSIEVVSPNTAKFLLTFIDGSTRYARWTDVSSGSDRQISLSGVLSIK